MNNIHIDNFLYDVRGKRTYIFKEDIFENKTAIQKNLKFYDIFNLDLLVDISKENLIFLGRKESMISKTDFSKSKNFSEINLNIETGNYDFLIKNSFVLNLFLIGVVNTLFGDYLWLQDDEENILLSKIVKCNISDIKISD